MRTAIMDLSSVLVCTAVGLSAAACADSNPIAPVVAARVVGESESDAFARGAPGITALTWNVYLGADIGRVLQARTAEEAVVLATEEWGHVQATDFPARAGALARAIAARRPHVVGLEELALFRTTDNPFEPATRVAYDFLHLVTDSLHARGLDYAAAAVDRTTDLQVPVIAGVDASGQPILAGVRWTDGDAVLVRADVPYTNPRFGVYDASQPVTIGGVTSRVYQGWSSVETTVGGRSYRFVATHLVGQEAQDVQLAQTGELIALLSAETLPTIVVGDFNSDAYGIDPTRVTPTYATMLAAGYRDTWVERERAPLGLTCCQQADLLNARSTFNQRIDFVFTRNLPPSTTPVRRGVVGDRRGDRTASGLWPSDHAGVTMTLLTPAEARRPIRQHADDDF
ncbi:MAG TPA: endonuclease/exonuclease/phosphatase family protein [Gemmatimonadales bacterium]|nr:endonuclease/exonuclease/phosphatase family protein [Gemmatimonadales bacterium]